MKTYKGWIDRAGNCHITVREDGKPGRMLKKRLDLSNHSPTGFSWGYGGSGPAQTALAVLADALDNDLRALRLHQSFKWHVIAHLGADDQWQLTDEAVRRIANELEVRLPASPNHEAAEKLLTMHNAAVRQSKA